MNKKTIIPNKAYDILKWVSMVFLGAFGEFYEYMANAWSLPYGAEIRETCMRLGIFLGLCLGFSTIQYKAQQAEERESKHAELQHYYDVLQEELTANASANFEKFDSEEGAGAATEAVSEAEENGEDETEQEEQDPESILLC